MSVGQIISIIDWTIKKYENIKKFVGEKVRQFRARSIRDAVNSHNAKSIDERVRDIKTKRRDRNDAG